MEDVFHDAGAVRRRGEVRKPISPCAEMQNSSRDTYQ